MRKPRNARRKEFREQTEATLKRVRVEQDDGSYKPLVKKEKKLN